MLGADRPGQLEEPIGEGRLAMVDVGDDREVADPVHAGSRSMRERDLCGRVERHPSRDCVSSAAAGAESAAPPDRRAVIATPYTAAPAISPAPGDTTCPPSPRPEAWSSAYQTP